VSDLPGDPRPSPVLSGAAWSRTGGWRFLLYLLRVRCFTFEFTAETQRTQRIRRGWLLAALRAPSAISASLR
jgi:hypothetical protein